MKASTTPNKWLELLKKLGILLFFLLLWQGAALLAGKEVLLPTPTAVLKRLWELCGTGEFWLSALFSLLRILAGFTAAAVLALPVGFLTSRSRLLRDFLHPVITVIKATPVASFIILALVWLSSRNVPPFTAFLMVFPVVWTGVDTGFSEADRELFEVTKVFGFSGAKRLRVYWIPAISPYFAASCKTGIGLAWKAGIAAEVLCTPALSIGRELYNSKIYLESTDLFAYTLTVILFSLIIEWLLGLLFGRISGRRRSDA